MDRSIDAATGRAKPASRRDSWRATSAGDGADRAGDCNRRTAASLDPHRDSARRAGVYVHQSVECGTESETADNGDWPDASQNVSGDTNDAAIERVSGGHFGVVVAMAASPEHVCADAGAGDESGSGGKSFARV